MVFPKKKISKAPPAILFFGVGGTGKSTVASFLDSLLKERGYKSLLIRFDEFRKHLAPAGSDPFSKDPEIKKIIYQNAAKEFSRLIEERNALVIDSGLSVDSIRVTLKEFIPNLKLVHITCPLGIAVWRDTKRSFREMLSGKKHERGSFLHLRAIRDYLNPFQKEKFPQPGITYLFEPPSCADLRINTFFKKPEKAAEEIIQRLGI